jgi:CRP-like cAMP-binding protein
VDQAVRSPNYLLASLAATDFNVLAPHLRTVELHQGTVLFEVGDETTRVYFPHIGVISLVVSLATGEMIETGMVGRDSLVGGSSALDGKISLNKGIVQIAGAASVLKLEHLRSLADASIAFRTMLIRHEQLILVQAQQSAACNISHTLEARLARWLLRCRDLMESDDLALTQEFLGQMLGVRRSSVSLIAGTLQQAGLIRYRRGHIRILDVEGMRDAACECYATVKSHSDRLLGAAAAWAN